MRLLVYIFVFFICFNSFSQGGFRSRCYSQTGISHVTKDIFEVSPGTYVAGGISIDANSVFSLTLMGLNSLGQVQWTKNYGTANLQYGNHPFVYRTFYKYGNYLYYTGAMIDSNQQTIGTLVKFDFSGNKIWQQFYSDPGMDVVPNIVSPSVDGGFLITGFFQSQTTTPTLLIKTDANGNELWRKIIHKAVPDVSDGRAILQDSTSKKIIIAGTQYIGNASSADIYTSLIVLDSLGTVLSHSHFSPGGYTDLIQTNDKKIVVTGVYLVSGFNAYYRSVAFKFDVNQPTIALWSIYGFDPLVQLNWFTSVMKFSNGDLLLAGSIDTLLEIDHRHNNLSRFVRINPLTGQVIWKKYYDYAANDSINNNILLTCVNPTSDGGWITSLRKNDAGNNPLFYVKYDSTGCDTSAQWCRSVELAINERSKISEYSFDLFPNPSCNYINIKIDAPVSKTFSLKITDVAGSLIYSTHILSNNSITLISSDYKTGIYYVSCFNEDHLIETKKMVIIH